MPFTEVKAPDDWSGGGLSLFLAGGITGTENWQTEAVERLSVVSNMTVLNPRRDDFDVTDQGAAVGQIEWEYSHLKRAYAVLFWFPPETLCPIALYELGAHGLSHKHLFVGTHPDYKRRFDVIQQLRLARPDVVVHSDVGRVCDEAIRYWTVRE
jgi:Nucleoside 2-deoxyribosyltransferase like